jgi:hypothetical protein
MVLPIQVALFDLQEPIMKVQESLDVTWCNTCYALCEESTLLALKQRVSPINYESEVVI